MLGRGGRLALVFVDDINGRCPPTQVYRTLSQIVLTLGTLAMMDDLEIGGLANIHECSSLKMVSSDLRQHRRHCHFLLSLALPEQHAVRARLSAQGALSAPRCRDDAIAFEMVDKVHQYLGRQQRSTSRHLRGKSGEVGPPPRHR
jgi:hypothetical protein